MSLDPNTLDIFQCVSGCVIKLGFNPLASMTWEAAASVPSQELRDLLFPYGEPLSYPDGPPSVICGLAFAAFVAECCSRAGVEWMSLDEPPLSLLRRCLAD